MQAIGGLYVTSPKEYSAAEFANAFPKLGIPAALTTDELKAALIDLSTPSGLRKGPGVTKQKNSLN